MLYAIYPKSSQNIIQFSWNSKNYQELDKEKKIKKEDIQIIYELLGKNTIENTIDKLNKYDLIFTAGPLLISDKVKKILAKEYELGLVQFIEVEIEKIGKLDNFYCLHIINYESVTDFDNSIYELEGWENDEYEFELQTLKKQFDWDLSIAKDKEVPGQIIINEDLKNRFINAGIKNIYFYSKIDSFNDDNSEFIKS